MRLPPCLKDVGRYLQRQHALHDSQIRVFLFLRQIFKSQGTHFLLITRVFRALRPILLTGRG